MTLRLNPIDSTALARMAEDLPQSILITGDDGIGLRTAAEHLARLSNRQIVKTIVPNEKGTIKIEDVRALYDLVRGKNKGQVVLIDDADSMSSAAQNAFLKLLEEPIGQTTFIMTSHAPGGLLPTVASRVQSVQLHKISKEESMSLLQDLKVSDATATSQMLFIADGLPAKLTRLATDTELFTTNIAIVRAARTFLTGTTESRLLTAITFAKDRLEATMFIDSVIKLARLSLAQDPQERTINLVNALLETKTSIEENGNVRLLMTRASL